MSESGGISENPDAGFGDEESQEDRMPVSTRPNSRVSVDGDPGVMTSVELYVIKPSSEKETSRLDGRRSCCGHEWKC